MAFACVYVEHCVGITKIITPRTLTAAELWFESRCRAGRLLSSLEVRADKGPVAETAVNLSHTSNNDPVAGLGEGAVLFAVYALTLISRDALAQAKVDLLSCCCEEVEWFPSLSMIVSIARLRPLCSLWPHRSLRLQLSVRPADFPAH
jgi:hypothetical protein